MESEAIKGEVLRGSTSMTQAPREAACIYLAANAMFNFLWPYHGYDRRHDYNPASPKHRASYFIVPRIIAATPLSKIVAGEQGTCPPAAVLEH